MKPNRSSNPFLRVATLGFTALPQNPSLSLGLALAIIPLGIPSAFAATRTWDGGASTANMDTATNWSADTLPTTDADIAQWAGLVGGDLSLTYTLGTFGGAGGMSIDMTAAQTGALTINEASGTNGMRMRDITIANGAGAFSFGTTTASFMTLGSGTVLAHTFTNNSTSAATLGTNTNFGFGGSGAHTLTLTGAGNWNFGAKLGTGGGSLSTLTKTGIGNLVFTGTTGGSGQSNIGTFNAGAGRTSIGTTNAITAGFINIGSVASGAAAFYQSGTTSSVTNTNTAGGGFQIGGAVGSSGYYNHSGGVINVGGEFDVGGSSGGSGTFGQFDMSGGTLNLPNITGSFFLVNRGAAGETAVVNIGGTVQIAGGATPANSNINGLAMGLANVGNLTSTITLSGSGQFLTPSLTVKLNDTNFGASSNATNVSVLNMNGGTLQTLGFGTAVNAGGGNGSAVMNLNGGMIKAGTAGNTSFLSSLGAVNVYSGNGTIDNNGQAITIGQNLLAASGTGVSSVAVSAAGTGYVSPPKVVFSGGTLTGSLGANTATGYATIDASTGAVTGIVITSPGSYTSTAGLAVSLVGPTGGTAATLGTLTQNSGNTSGGMTFQGLGTTRLTGASTYTGVTAVNSGTLLVNGSLAAGSSVTVASGATLGGGVGGTAGTINGSVSSAGTLAPGGVSAVGTLALSGGLTLNGGFINLDLSGASNTAGGTTNDLINVTGNVSASGVVLVSPVFSTTPAANTTYQFASYTGSLTGGANFTAASRAITVNTGIANQLSLTYTGASSAALTWDSTSSGAWDVVASQNWKNGVSPDYFYQGDSVTFDDAVGVQTAITVNNLVTPGSTTVSSNTNNFSFSGTNAIGGTGTLTKSGASVLTISNANTFSGGTALSAGTLNLNNASAIGTGALTITGGTIDNTTAAGITLSTNNVQSWNGDFAFGGTKALNLGTGAVTLGANRTITTNGTTEALTVGGVISGTGFGLTKTGTGTLTLAGINTFTGNILVSNGTLTAGTGISGALATSIASNLGDIGTAVSRSITIDNGGILSLTGGNVLGTGGSTGTLAGVALAVNQGGIFQTGLNSNAAGWWNKIGAVTLNGGTIRVGSGANTTSFQGLALIGDVTVGGTSTVASTIDNLPSSQTTSNGVHLGQNATAGQVITFNVADVTGDAASDLNVSARLLNTSSNLTASGLTKTGAGTMTLSGANAYTGTTTISAGTLSISADNHLGASAAAVSLNGGTLRTTNTSAVTNTHVITIGASGGTLNIAGNGGATTGQGDRVLFGTANTLMGSGALTVTGGGTLSGAGPNSTTAGAGVLVLNAANGYSGNLSLQSGGLLEYAVANALGSGATVTLGNEGELAVTNGQNVSNALTVSGGTNSVLSFTNATGTFSGPITANANLTVGLRDWYNYGNAHSGSITGVISGAGGLTVDPGTGTGGVLTLTNTNSYTGATTVNGGKLIVNGNISTSILTTVNNTGSLGGSGTVGALTAVSGGTVSPGNSPGVLSAGNTDLQSGSTLTIELNGTTVGTTYDQLNVTGSVSLAGTLSLSLGYAPLNGDLLFILANDGTDAITGTFSGLADGSMLNVGGQDFQISYFGDSVGNSFTGGNDVALMAVPEPTTAMLIGSLGALGLLRRRRNG